MLNGWFSSSSSPKKPDNGKRKIIPKTKRDVLFAMYDKYPVEARFFYTLAAGCVAGTLVTVAFVKLHKRFWRRFPTHEWITPDLYDKKRWIKGLVTSVGDPDGFRLYHTPISALYWKLKGVGSPTGPKGLKTVSVRLAGIDAPEYGHFNKEAQPFAVEALNWLKSRILGQVVYCQLLKRDQYGRAVAEVMLPGGFGRWFLTPWWGKPLADEMLREGLAVTYTEGGAVYGRGGLEGHLAIEAKAKKQRRGQWVNGPNLETPAEYKRRHRTPNATEEVASESEDIIEQASDGDAIAGKTRRRRKSDSQSFLSRLFGSQ